MPGTLQLLAAKTELMGRIHQAVDLRTVPEYLNNTP